MYLIIMEEEVLRLLLYLCLFSEIGQEAIVMSKDEMNNNVKKKVNLIMNKLKVIRHTFVVNVEENSKMD